MSAHFCKVGRIKPNLNKLVSLIEFEKRISNFVEDISMVDFPKTINGELVSPIE